MLPHDEARLPEKVSIGKQQRFTALVFTSQGRFGLQHCHGDDAWHDYARCFSTGSCKPEVLRCPQNCLSLLYITYNDYNMAFWIMFSQPFLIGDVHIEGHGKPYCLSPKDYATLPAGFFGRMWCFASTHHVTSGTSQFTADLAYNLWSMKSMRFLLFVDEVLGRASHFAKRLAITPESAISCFEAACWPKGPKGQLKVQCRCGGSFLKKHRSYHLKMARHKTYESRKWRNKQLRA